MEKMKTEMGQVQEQEDLTITMEDVRNVSKNLPNWKAAGPKTN